MFSSRSFAGLLIVVAAVALVPGVAAAAVSTANVVCQPGLSVSLLPQQGARAAGREANYIVATLEPGQRLQREVRICNGTDAELRVSVYANAAAIQDGTFLPLGTPRADNDLSRWTTVQPSSLVLRPDDPVDVDVTIDVPRDAEAGERYAVVYAEVPPAAGSGVAVASRVGVREYVFVRGDAAPRADFVIDTLTAARLNDGRPAVRAQVKNIGDLALDISGTLQLTDGPGGISAGPFPVSLGTTIVPGGSASIEVLLDRALPSGPWLAQLDLASGTTMRSARARITFPDEAGVAADPVAAENLSAAEDPKILVPIAGSLILLIALLLLWWLIARRRTKDEEEEREDEELVPTG